MSDASAARPFADTTMIIPVKIDGPDRLFNLQTIVRYIERHLPGARIHVLEFDSERRIPSLPSALVRQEFIEQPGPFCKALAVNHGVAACQTPILAIYDADMLVEPSAARRAVELIRSRRYPFALPYNRICVDVDGERRRQIAGALDAGSLFHVQAQAAKLNDSDSTVRTIEGGILFADVAALKWIGGLNQRMVSYGWEDIEVLHRAEALGLYYHIGQKSLVHLNHARGVDSAPNPLTFNNKQEYLRMRAMPASALRGYVEEELLPLAGWPGGERPIFTAGRIEFLLGKTLNRLRVEGLASTAEAILRKFRRSAAA